jgi:iron complex outermembrane receptor protein
MMALFRWTLVLLVALALAWVPIAVAAAQDAPAPDTIRPVALAPVVVTALRTPFRLDVVPYAVAVNTRTEIQRGRPGMALDEALDLVPGVQVDDRYNYAVGERIAVRGFGARAQFGVRGVKVYLDGVPATLPDGQTSLGHIDPAFLRRAEVIRGPAAALYGNTAGGVIHFETEAPPPVPLGQELGVSAGSHGLLRLHSTTGGRSGRAEYLFNLSRLGYDGYREHSGARLVRANGKAGYAGARDTVRLSFSAVDLDSDNPGSLSEALLEADRFQAFSNNVLQHTGKTAQEAQLGVSWRRALWGGEWESAAYTISRSVVNPIPTAIIDLDRSAYGASVRFHHGAADGSLQWVAGVEADRQRDDRQNYTNERGERGALGLDQLEHVDNLSAFAQLSGTALPRLTLLAGARADWFRFSAADRLVGDGEPDDSGRRTMQALSPTVGASYAFAEALHLYANAATSFETPTTTELANRPDGAGGFNPELEPQRTRSVELGAKGRIAGRLAYQLAAYRATVENSLIPFEVPEAPGRQFFRNAGRALHRGAEAGATLAAAEWLALRASYSYTDARFTAYRTAADTLDGNRVPGVAPHRLEAAATLEPRGGWYATLEARRVSRIPVNDANAAYAPAYTLAGLRFGSEQVRLGRLEVAPFAGIENLFDRDYITAVAVNAFGGRYFEPGPRRSVYFGARMRL